MKPFQYIGRAFLGTGLLAALVAAGSMDGSGGLWLVAVLATTAVALLLASAAMFIAARKVGDLECELYEIDLAIKEYLESNYGEENQEEEIQWN